MTKEQLEKDCYKDRPLEPYCDDDSPNDWANIAHYVEYNLEKAFKRIGELEIKRFNNDLSHFLYFLVGMVVGLIYATCSLHFIHHVF